jgi:adenylate kinase
MNIVMLGAQGSGKGTQASLLSEHFKIPHIDVGSLLREEASKNSAVGLKIKNLIDKGELVPDELVIEIVKARLKAPDCKNGFVLDGFPRTKHEAESMDSFAKIDRVVLLEVDDKSAIARLSKRRQCVKCDTIYGPNIRPKKTGLCDKCSGKLVQRADDKPEFIKRRLEIYHKESSPIIEHYRTKNILLTFDGAEEINVLAKKIIKKLAE